MAVTFLVLLIAFLQFVCVAHGHGGNDLCLSCPLVGHPRDCRSFVEIWPHERCTTDLILLLNGTTVYKFGHKVATECAQSEDGQSEHLLRQRRVLNTAIPVCQECCAGNLCNRKICGLPDSNSSNLACLVGAETSGLPLDTSIAYCNEGEWCFTGRTQRTRPNMLNFACASQMVCAHLARTTSDAVSCQECCSHDGCNANICTGQITPPTSPPPTYTDCWDLHSRGGYTRSGVYDIYPRPGVASVRVKCDMDTDGGGWTTLQKRYDGSTSFTRTLTSYTDGFGDHATEHWLGLENIYVLTSSQSNPVQLRIDLCAFNNQTGYASYDGFSISHRDDSYRLLLGNYSGGTLQNMLSLNNGRLFQTRGLCANLYMGGWWYHGDGAVCYNANLNGGTYSGDVNVDEGIVWRGFGSETNEWPSLRSSEMRIRPINATGDSSRPYTCPT